jgi:hypothetical protein
MKEHDFCACSVLTTRQLEQNEHLEIIARAFSNFAGPFLSYCGVYSAYLNSIDGNIPNLLLVSSFFLGNHACFSDQKPAILFKHLF